MDAKQMAPDIQKLILKEFEKLAVKAGVQHVTQ